MSGAEYLEGAVAFALMLAATGAAAFVLQTRLAPRLDGATRATALGVLWLAAIFFSHLVPGMVEVLDRWVVVLSAGVLALAAHLATRGRRREAAGAGFPEAPSSSPGSWLLALVGGGALVLLLAALLVEHRDDAVRHVDVVSFHLPNMARWLQGSSLWSIDEFIPDRAPGYYPNTGDVFSLSVVLPWGTDFLVRFVNYPLLLLAGLGTYGLARELRAPAATAALVAAAFLAMPVVSWVAYVALADVSMVATFAAGSFFLLRHARTRDPFDLALAGLGLGLALGTRWYAVPAVGAVGLVWTVAELLRRTPPAVFARRFGMLVGLVLLTGGFWMLRNLVQAGNPLFPLKVELGGLTVFDAPRDVFRELEGWSISDYLLEPDIWRDFFFDSFLDAMSAASLLLWAGLAAGLVATVVLLRRSRADGTPQTRGALALVAGAAIIGLAYLVTPYTATGPEDQPLYAAVNSRYVVPALVLGVGVTAWLLGLVRGRLRLVLEVALLAGLAHGLERTLELPETDLGLRAVAVTVVGLVALAVAAAVLLALWRSGRRPVALALAAVGALLVVAAGDRQQSDFLAARYVGTNAAASYINDVAPEGRRIGLVGEGWGNYPLFGPRLENEVEYIGPFVDDMLRTHQDRDAFVRAVRGGRYDLVVVQDFQSVVRDLARRQERWLQDLGYKAVAEGQQSLVAGSPDIRVYRPPSGA